eukprot:1185030-Prorocentrum_minimum.AAC.2
MTDEMDTTSNKLQKVYKLEIQLKQREHERDEVGNITSIYGPFCANNGKGCTQHPSDPSPFLALFSPLFLLRRGGYTLVYLSFAVRLDQRGRFKRFSDGQISAHVCPLF